MKFRYFKQGDIHRKKDFNFFQRHHYFWGDIIALAGFYGVFNWSPYVFIPLLALGSWVRLDDVFQHIIQWFEIEMTKKDDYPGHYRTVSLFHWIFYKKYWDI